MAKKKVSGRGWHGDSAGHAKAGRKGGQVTSMTHDETFYSRIGRKGGKKSSGKFKDKATILAWDEF